MRRTGGSNADTFYSATLPERFGALERVLEEGDWVIGNQMSLADVVLYEFVESLDDPSRARKALATAPALEHRWWNFKNLPAVEAWEEKRPATPF